ncbi:MAG: hypothetical protein AB7P99_04760 [Vicinamibacterales bacterium]
MSTPTAVEVTAGALVPSKGYIIGQVALEILRPLTRDEWEAIGRRLRAVASATQWAIGDWLVFGQGCGEYGQTYQRAAEITGRSWETLSQYARVSRAYARDCRRPDVSWTIHREALRLLEADRPAALALAASKGWTRERFAGHVDKLQRRALGKYSKDPDHAPARLRQRVARWRTNGPKGFTICPSCGHRIEHRRKGDAAGLGSDLEEPPR